MIAAPASEKESRVQVLVAAVALVWIVSCGDDDAAQLEDASGSCDGMLLYFAAGCEDVSPVCAHGPQDLCAGPACSCGGESILIGCGFNGEPFASYGACPGDEDAEVPGPE